MGYKWILHNHLFSSAAWGEGLACETRDTVPPARAVYTRAGRVKVQNFWQVVIKAVNRLFFLTIVEELNWLRKIFTKVEKKKIFTNLSFTDLTAKKCA